MNKADGMPREQKTQRTSHRKPLDQIAALPIMRDKSGRLRVLMVTSRETKRWVMPKGWTMDGKKPWAAAEIEALEEAGAVRSAPTTTARSSPRMPGSRAV